MGTQISFFDGSNKFVNDKPIRLIELFAGIGSQAKALKNLGIPFEHYRVCEFDHYAIKSYNAIHGTSFEMSDIRELLSEDLGIVDTDRFLYICTYSFPCVDLSIAGKQKGMKKGGDTRSGLLWEVERLLDGMEELPQILLMENVTQVHSDENIEDFCLWLNKLESLGYKNYWQDLDVKDFGVPQSRKRTFCISVLGDYYVDFPTPFKLTLRLKDIMEDVVDEKYYLPEKYLENLDVIEYEKPIGDEPCVNQIFNLMPSKTRENLNQGRLYDKDGIAPTLCCMEGGNRQPYIVDDTYKGRSERVYSDYSPTLRAERNGFLVVNAEPILYGGIGEKKSNGGTQWYQQDRIYDSEGIAMCHPAQIPEGSYKYKIRLKEGDRIRRLTPKECFRLMAFSDEDFERASKVNKDTQLYKQSGNSIGVNVLMAIFKELLLRK